MWLPYKQEWPALKLMLQQALQGTTHPQRILEVVLRALKRPVRWCTGRQRSCKPGLRPLLAASSWLGRVQSLFGDAASAQPTPQAWAPSPLTSPPRQSLPLQPRERGGRIVQNVGQVLLFSGANAQQHACHGAEGPFALQVSRQTSEH